MLGLTEPLAFLLYGFSYFLGVFFGVDDGVAPASGLGFEAGDAFFFIAIEPVVDRDLVEPDDASDLFGGSFFGFEQHEVASFSEGMRGSVAVAVFEFGALLGIELEGSYVAHGVFLGRIYLIQTNSVQLIQFISMTCTAIITPVYVSPEFPSRLELFDKTVASVNMLASDGATHLHIVVDDGSTDPEGIKRVLEKYDDSRIRYLRRERKATDLKTASNALNFGINAVLDGHEKIPEYKNIDSITPLHSDDLMYDIASRAKSLEPADVGATLSKIVVLRDNRETIHEPNFTMSARDYVTQGISPYPVTSIMWKPSTLEGMKRYNKEKLPDNQRFDGVYHPDFVNVEDVSVTKLTALYLCNANLHIAASGEISMLYRYHQDSLRGKTDEDLWNLNNRMMEKMYYELLGYDHTI